MTIQTDLHTHFAGVLTADELIRLGLAHGASVDVNTAQRLGIVKPGYSGPAIPLSELAEKDMATLKAAMELAPEKRNLFNDLEKIYINREFITKDFNLFVPLLEKIAQTYEQQGVSYTELSSTSVIGNPQLIRAIHENAPRIEAETGVNLRFLGALWRHSDPEWNMDQADRLKSVLLSPYVVGVDIVGHEKNPIRYMKEPLQEIISFAAKNISGCVVRLHAGENPYYSADPATLDDNNFNNAYEAVQIADNARRDANGAFLGKYGRDMQIRIGHGRYGLQPATLRLIAETGTIPELCLSSNMLLNHADNFKGPFNLYAKNGIPFVLGSDGCGLYGATLPDEYANAVRAGMTLAARKTLEETENFVIAKDKERFKEKMAAWRRHEIDCAAKGAEEGIDPFDATMDRPYSTLDGKPRWSPDITASRKKDTLTLYDALMSFLDDIEINTDAVTIDSLLRERNALIFRGSSKTSWENVPLYQQRKVVETMKALIDSLDGRKEIVITEGTDYGFAAVIHRLLEEHNKHLPDDARIPVVGAITLEAGADEIRQGALSHAIILQYDGEFARTWMDQSPALMELIARADAKVIVAGGGQVIRDMIIYADRCGLIDERKVFLFDGINGASNEANYPFAKFRSAEELLKMLAEDKAPVTRPVKPRHPKPAPGSL